MEDTLYIGIVLLIGFLLGRLANRFNLPKVTGYIIAGIGINPHLFNYIPNSFISNTATLTDISLAFITFSVGGTLSRKKLLAHGREIIILTLFEAFGAYFFTIAGLLFFAYLMPMLGFDYPYLAYALPLSILMASLASPTDPSASLAVAHEYKAKGPVTDTIMAIAAFDDATGIIIFSVSIGVATIFLGENGLAISSILNNSTFSILGAILLGTVSGMLFNAFTHFFKLESEGTLIIVIFGFLSLCFGVAGFIGVEQLLATMTMGTVVTNYNRQEESIFRMLERYTEEIIFLLFFVISGMHLNFTVLGNSLILVAFFIISRAIGKYSGVYLGGLLANSEKKIKKYTAGGLIPQGGIVIGLALMMHKNPNFAPFADVIVSGVMGATIIHEVIGPILAKRTLKNAGEI